MERVCVIGEGAWGTAFSTLLAHNGHEVLLWCFHESVANQIKESRENSKYLPGVVLDEKIKPITSFDEAKDATWIFEAIPVKFLRSILEKFAPFYKKEQKWVALSKGIENETLFFPRQILNSVFNDDVVVSLLLGPSFAKDLSEKKVTGVTIASKDKLVAVSIQKIVNNEYFSSFYTDDLIGAEIGAAMKNVLALGFGIVHGAGYSDNTKALLFTRGFEEIIKLAVVMGGRRETLCSFSGIGDMVLTCLGKHSRNIKTGILIGQGKSIDEILNETGMIPEGANTSKSLNKLSEKYNVDIPICCSIYKVAFGLISIDEFIKGLLQ